MGIEGVNGGSKNYNLVIDQNNDKYLYVTNNNITIPGANFQDILGAKLVNENGQNMHTCQVSDQVPGYQKHGINLMA